jgi:ATP adenylyltransferase
MRYVSAAGGPPGACIFCAALASSDDRQNLVVHRGERAYVILNAFPYASGHAMVAPARHVGGIEEATPEELTEIMTLVGRVIRALRTEYRPHGFNLGVNQGRAAGAGMPDHVHVHVVPRWEGDNSFMPVVGETRVLPESLEATYDRLRAALCT